MIGALPGKLRFYVACQGDRLRRWCYWNLIRLRQGGRARYSVLCSDPLVIYAAFNAETGLLFPLPARALFLLAIYDSAEDEQQLESAMRFIAQQRERSPGVRFVVLANTERETQLFRARGQEAELINHNAFADERVFTVDPAAGKTFDAIYDAQLHPFKRHYLAADVPRLALISYLHRPSPDLAYAREMRRKLGGATWLNDPLAPHHRLLTPPEVNSALNAARTGLCLSASEGAMYASVQYLLCGLPVVTTPSRGGRDYFFEPDFVEVVEPDAAAVAQGVAHLIRRAPPPAEIRRRTLRRAEALRGRFIALVQAHLDRHAPGIDFAARFQREFFHTLVKKQKPGKWPSG